MAQASINLAVMYENGIVCTHMHMHTHDARVQRICTHVYAKAQTEDDLVARSEPLESRISSQNVYTHKHHNQQHHHQVYHVALLFV